MSLIHLGPLLPFLLVTRKFACKPVLMLVPNTLRSRPTVYLSQGSQLRLQKTPQIFEKIEIVYGSTHLDQEKLFADNKKSETNNLVTLFL
jgi:hypothetical protein